IMGVGEDETLGEAIGVTVIATGFHIDQQDDIVNSESKKIIHTLEEEQKAVRDLIAKEIVHVLEEEPKMETKVVKHTLFEEELDLIPTTSYIKNFNVFYEEVIADHADSDFIIIDSKDALNDIEVVEPVVVSNKKVE